MNSEPFFHVSLQKQTSGGRLHGKQCGKKTVYTAGVMEGLETPYLLDKTFVHPIQ